MPENANADYQRVEILLVEDNPSDVELTMAAFEKQRQANRVHVVRDGVEALDYLFGAGPYAGRDCRNVPKLILLDLKLPKVGGIEVLRSLREDPRTRLIPVVVLTSSREEKDVEETYRLGINSYIVKPVEFEKLTELIAHLCIYWLGVNLLAPMPQSEVK
ncbi:MAG: response regulator [Thermomicrobiales bacterium]